MNTRATLQSVKSVKVAAESVMSEQGRPIILNLYWERKNVYEVQSDWRREICIRTSSGVQIGHIRDKFEA
jgi:hypothetical protein